MQKGVKEIALQAVSGVLLEDGRMQTSYSKVACLRAYETGIFGKPNPQGSSGSWLGKLILTAQGPIDLLSASELAAVDDSIK